MNEWCNDPGKKRWKHREIDSSRWWSTDLHKLFHFMNRKLLGLILLSNARPQISELKTVTFVQQFCHVTTKLELTGHRFPSLYQTDTHHVIFITHASVHEDWFLFEILGPLNSNRERSAELRFPYLSIHMYSADFRRCPKDTRFSHARRQGMPRSRGD